MRGDETGRPSVLKRLFAERHVFLRSGAGSRYVRISSGLQVAVTILFLAAVAALAAASYSSVVNHLEAAERTREVARLEDVNKSLLAATDAARRGDELRGTDVQMETLQARLDESEGSRAEAEERARAAGAEVEDARQELGRVQGQLEESRQQLATLEAEREALTTLLNAQSEDGDGETRDEALQAQVADLASERAALQAELDQLREASGNADEQLEAARQRIAALEEDARQDETEQVRTVEELEVRAARLRSENERLSQALTEVRTERHDLSTQLQEAEAATEGGNGDGAGAVEVERLRDELEAAQARVAELEQAVDVAAVMPEAGPPSDGNGPGGDGSPVRGEEVERLEGALADAEQKIRELEAQIADAEPEPPAETSLQRRPAIGDAILASDLGPDEDDRRLEQIAPAAGYQDANAALAALEAELTAASELSAALADAEAQEVAPERVAELRDQMTSASQRIGDLSATVERLSRRDVALQRALVTLSPLPPPPAPR